MEEYKNETWIEWAKAWNRAREHYNLIRKKIEKRKLDYLEKLKKQTTIGD